MAIETGRYVENSIFFYAPSKPAPLIFTLLFTLSFLLHLYQCIHYKSWKFTGLFPWAALVFVAGYATRTYAAFGHYDNVDVFIAATVLVYAAPPVYELANYITLGRVLYYVPYHSPLHPGRVITTFGGLSAVVEILTGNGASYASNRKNSEGAREAGRAMLKAALVIQLGVIVSFVALAAFFHVRCKRERLLPRKVAKVLWTLYASMAIIFVRTVYRTVEYFSIEDINWVDVDPQSLSPLMRYEWYFWVFEGAIMMVNTWLMNFYHPARFLPRRNNVYLAQDGVTEVEGPGYKDKRPFWQTLLDPFDVVGIVKREDQKNRYWEEPPTGCESGGVGGGAGGEATTTAAATAPKRNVAMVLLDPFDIFGRVTGKRKERQAQGKTQAAKQENYTAGTADKIHDESVKV